MKIIGHQAGCSTTCLAYLMCAKLAVRLHFKLSLMKSGNKSFVYLLHQRALQQSQLYIHFILKKHNPSCSNVYLTSRVTV